MLSETQEFVAANLAALRKSASMSQSQLARELIICRSSYSQYERGERLPDMMTMYQLAQFYHVTIDALINCDTQSVLAEYFLHSEYSRDEIEILSAFAELTDFSKGQLVQYAIDLAQAETEKKQFL